MNEIKGFPEYVARIIAQSVGAELPRKGQEIPISDGVVLKRTEPSQVIGRQIPSETWEYWLESRNPNTPFNTICALVNAAQWVKGVESGRGVLTVKDATGDEYWLLTICRHHNTPITVVIEGTVESWLLEVAEKRGQRWVVLSAKRITRKDFAALLSIYGCDTVNWSLV
jgi:hypothetical protein